MLRQEFRRWLQLVLRSVFLSRGQAASGLHETGPLYLAGLQTLWMADLVVGPQESANFVQEV